MKNASLVQLVADELGIVSQHRPDRKRLARRIVRLVQSERQCVECGCTDSFACEGGCSWVIKHKATNTGVCSRCRGDHAAKVDEIWGEMDMYERR
jgi:transcription elongation factor Elf1